MPHQWQWSWIITQLQWWPHGRSLLGHRSSAHSSPLHAEQSDAADTTESEGWSGRTESVIFGITLRTIAVLRVAETVVEVDPGVEPAEGLVDAVAEVIAADKLPALDA